MIAENQFCNAILNFRALVEKEFKDDWLIALQMDHNYQVKIVNVKNPQYKQIINLINASNEYGIRIRSNKLYENGVLMLYFLFEKVAPENLLNLVDDLLSKRRIQIAFNELESLFLLLFFGLIVSICILIIEILFSKIFYRILL